MAFPTIAIGHADPVSGFERFHPLADFRDDTAALMPQQDGVAGFEIPVRHRMVGIAVTAGDYFYEYFTCFWLFQVYLLNDVAVKRFVDNCRLDFHGFPILSVLSIPVNSVHFFTYQLVRIWERR